MEKLIHYCWFGQKRKPELIRRCISSWKKHAPSFKIIEWNEKNFDINKSPQYVEDAYKAKKYAFVSDYVRFYVLKKYGGIYLDTDVELIKDIDLSNIIIPSLALEKSLEINPGLFMAIDKNDPICDYMLESYESSTFFTDKYNQTVCQRIMRFFDSNGFVQEDKNQEIGRYHIYSSEYFSPMDEKTRKTTITNNTISIHWFNASWLTIREKLGKKPIVSKIIKYKNKLFNKK